MSSRPAPDRRTGTGIIVRRCLVHLWPVFRAESAGSKIDQDVPTLPEEKFPTESSMWPMRGLVGSAVKIGEFGAVSDAACWPARLLELWGLLDGIDRHNLWRQLWSNSVDGRQAQC